MNAGVLTQFTLMSADMRDTATPHDHEVTVLAEDIDFMGHANNAHYLRWVQDAVLAHWHKLAPPADLWLPDQGVAPYRGRG